MWSDFIKECYDSGVYTDSDMSTFVQAGYITAAQYKEITGEDYNPA